MTGLSKEMGIIPADAGIDGRVLKATFVRTQGQRDRIYVTRSNGSQVQWVFPTYGDRLPHDLVHLVVETAFGLTRGFWGRVDEGVDPGRITLEANQMGGKDKYSGFGDDQRELALAEALAATNWSRSDRLDHLREQCEIVKVDIPETGSEERAEETRVALASLESRWRTLLPKGSLNLVFHCDDPVRGLGDLRSEAPTSGLLASSGSN